MDEPTPTTRNGEAPHAARRSGLGRTSVVLVALLLAILVAPAAHAVQVQDLVRLKGAESSKLVGMGLVVGLNGTGDGVDSATTMRRLAAMMNRLGDPLVNAAEFENAENVAVVYASAEIPAGGIREGDQIDVHLAAPSAESLEGGRLVLTPLLGPLPGSPIYAYAEGPLTLQDPDADRTAVVEQGATLTRDVYAHYLDESGRLNLILNNANATWPMATRLATMINDLLAPGSPPIAEAIDQKNIVVQVPPEEQQAPGRFISRVLEVQIDPSLVRTEARVVINEKTGTIVMTGGVQLSPVVISHEGLTITTVTPEPQPTPQNPRTEQKQFLGLDPAGRGGASLSSLLTAFNKLKVPAKDRIAILKEIHRSGKLHARLILEE